MKKHLLITFMALAIALNSFSQVPKSSVSKFNTWKKYTLDQNSDPKEESKQKLNTIFTINQNEITYWVVGQENKKFVFVIDRYDVIDNVTVQYYTHYKTNPSYTCLIVVKPVIISLIDDETINRFGNEF